MPEIVKYLSIGVAIALVIYSIILHEIAHAYAAFRLGDPTAAMQGRLTLNPIKHIDPFNTVLMPMLTYYFGGFIFGGAKPVPINPYNFRNMRKGMMISGIAGPAVNLGLVLVFAALHRAVRLMPFLSPWFSIIFFLVGFWNMLLLAFNLIPVPPLDGSRVVSYFLPRHLQKAYDRLEQFGLILIILLIYTGVTRYVIYGGVIVFVKVAGEPPPEFFDLMR